MRPQPAPSDSAPRGGQNSPYQRAVSAEFCRNTFRKYTPWVDEDGEEQSLHVHPNFRIVESLLRNYPELLAPEWRDEEAFVYGLAAVIGMRPSKRYRLVTIESGQLIGPDTALWERKPRSSAEKRELRRRAREGETIPRMLLTEPYDPSRLQFDFRALARAEEGHRESGRREEASRQRAEVLGEVVCDCLPTVECLGCERLRRAGDDGETNGCTPVDCDA